MRQCSRSSEPSNSPKTVCVFPTSIARSAMRPSLLQRKRRNAPVPVDAVVDEAAGVDTEREEVALVKSPHRSDRGKVPRDVEIELAECGAPPVADEPGGGGDLPPVALLPLAVAGR